MPFQLYRALKHIPPRCYTAQGAFTNLSYCLNCCTVAAKEDMSPIKPCPYCYVGTVVDRRFYGLWKRSERSLFQSGERGEWVFMGQTRIALSCLYDIHHNPFYVNPPNRIVEPKLYYDLDFTGGSCTK